MIGSWPAGSCSRRKDVKVLEGGMAAWEKAGYPVKKWEEKK